MSLRTAWESLADRSEITLDEFIKSAAVAERHDVFVVGQDVGAILVIGPEVHACIKPAGFGRWFGRRAAAILAGVISKHGFATTSVTAGNEVGHKFVTRLGFRQVGFGPVWTYRKE